jgi:hypothetical protein
MDMRYTICYIFSLFLLTYYLLSWTRHSFLQN